MKIFVIALVAIAAMSGVVMLNWHHGPAPAYADGNRESLTTHMDHMRRLTHKLGLSIDAKNTELAKFYMQEIAESVTFFQKSYPDYDGFQIGALSQAMLTPYLMPLGKALEGGDWNAANSGYDTLISAGCNGCHTATQHAFIKIVRSKTNPYNQDFKP